MMTWVLQWHAWRIILFLEILSIEVSTFMTYTTCKPHNKKNKHQELRIEPILLCGVLNLLFSIKETQTRKKVGGLIILDVIERSYVRSWLLPNDSIHETVPMILNSMVCSSIEKLSDLFFLISEISFVNLRIELVKPPLSTT